MELGKKILNLRKKNNLSQEDLAKKIGVTRQTISNWELGESGPDINQAKKLAQEFKISLDELTGNENIKIDSESNVETLAGMTIKFIKFIKLALIFVITISICFGIIGLVGHFVLDGYHQENIICTLNGEEYKYEISWSDKTTKVENYNLDKYISDNVDVSKFIFVSEYKNAIDSFFEDQGGECKKI